MPEVSMAEMLSLPATTETDEMIFQLGDDESPESPEDQARSARFDNWATDQNPNEAGGGPGTDDEDEEDPPHQGAHTDS